MQQSSFSSDFNFFKLVTSKKHQRKKLDKTLSDSKFKITLTNNYLSNMKIDLVYNEKLIFPKKLTPDFCKLE